MSQGQTNEVGSQKSPLAWEKRDNYGILYICAIFIKYFKTAKFCKKGDHIGMLSDLPDIDRAEERFCIS